MEVAPLTHVHQVYRILHTYSATTPFVLPPARQMISVIDATSAEFLSTGLGLGLTRRERKNEKIVRS